MMTSKNVVAIYAELADFGVTIWVDGGWGVDALLGKQIRSHKDLDIAVQWKDVPMLRATLAARGYQQVRDEGPRNFVLRDHKEHEIDVHAFVRDDKENVIKGIMYPVGSFTGFGTIDGHEVRCISSQYMVKFLAEWLHDWPEKYVPAISALCEKFDIECPEEYVGYKKSIEN